MAALGPAAPVWKHIPQVAEVLHIIAPPIPDSPLPTVVIPLLEHHIRSLPVGCNSITPAANALDVLADKAAFADYSSRLKLRTPAVYLSLEKAQFPCVIKRTNLNGGAGIEIAASVAHAKELLSTERFPSGPVICQELVKNEREHVAHCICREGRVVWIRVYAYALGEQPAINRAGLGRPESSEITQEQLAQIEAFLIPLKYNGPCAVDYTLDDNGSILVFEINPRLGGSLMRPENGHDLREALCWILRLATGQCAAPIPFSPTH